jgi:hypothetical protein
VKKASGRGTGASADLEDQALQVMRFGDGEKDGVILRLHAAFQYAEGLACV